MAATLRSVPGLDYDRGEEAGYAPNRNLTAANGQMSQSSILVDQVWQQEQPCESPQYFPFQ
ncbi:unnamed protein product [Clonostachys rhizophaga]|uniref:Uncharacterized protein n=1 Tax=Clonostachys rhizophaga TaxID=160324 RepID=A0A9N9V9K2_9HYPO|nr:unnamed protein product [Clonostachys rhizophaga]